MVIAIDGPAGAGKSTVARAVAARARLHLPRLRGDVPLRGAGRASRPESTPTTPRRSAPLAAGLEIGFDGRPGAARRRDVSAAIREPEVTAAASRVSVHPRVREAMVARQRAADRRRPLRRRGPRHRHRGQPRGAAEGLPHRLRRGAGAAPGGRRPARTSRRCSPPSADRDARDTRARARRPARRRGRGRARHHRRSSARRGRRPGRRARPRAGPGDEPRLPDRRRRRLPQRRQEHAGQPAGRRHARP